MLAYLVVLIRLCGAETAIEHDELGGAVGILDGCDTAEVRPPAHLRDEIGTRGCDSHRALPQGHGGRGALNTSVLWGGGHRGRGCAAYCKVLYTDNAILLYC